MHLDLAQSHQHTHTHSHTPTHTPTHTASHMIIALLCIALAEIFAVLRLICITPRLEHKLWQVRTSTWAHEKNNPYVLVVSLFLLLHYAACVLVLAAGLYVCVFLFVCVWECVCVCVCLAFTVFVVFWFVLFHFASSIKTNRFRLLNYVEKLKRKPFIKNKKNCRRTLIKQVFKKN